MLELSSKSLRDEEVQSSPDISQSEDSLQDESDSNHRELRPGERSPVPAALATRHSSAAEESNGSDGSDGSGGGGQQL